MPELDLIDTFRLVIAIYVGLMMPFSIYMLTRTSRTIPMSLIEAAEIDGASAFQIFRRVVLPLSGGAADHARRRQHPVGLNELLIALVSSRAIHPGR